MRKIQAALIYLDGLSIDQSEVETGRYGPSTAAAVLAFKKARHIVNRAYQTQEDDIVGIMTVAAMDRELREREIVPAQSLPHPRLRRCQCVGDGHPQQFLKGLCINRSGELTGVATPAAGSSEKPKKWTFRSGRIPSQR